MDKSKLNALERDLVEGLEGFLENVKRGTPEGKQYTRRRVALHLKPRPYTAARVREVRKLLQVSQALFAHFLGVSPRSVAGWEGGKKPPPLACRFMDEIRLNPAYWRKRVQQSVTAKARLR